MVKTLHEEIRLSEKLFGGKHPFWRTILGNVVALNTSITHAVESSIAISKSIPEVCGLIWTQWQGIRVRKATRDRWEKERHTKQKRPLNNSVAVFFFFLNSHPPQQRVSPCNWISVSPWTHYTQRPQIYWPWYGFTFDARSTWPTPLCLSANTSVFHHLVPCSSWEMCPSSYSWFVVDLWHH